MARVVVTADDFEAGDLPAVCALTGRPAEGMSATRADEVPLWPLLLVPLNLVAAGLAAVFASRRLDGWLPLTDDVVRRDERRRRIQLAAIAAAVLLVGLGMVIGGPDAYLLAALSGLASLGVVVWRAFDAVDAELDRSGRWVHLSGVADAFAEAVAREGRAVEAPGPRSWWREPRRVDRPSVRT